MGKEKHLINTCYYGWGVRDSQVLAILPLPIAGLMSDALVEEVAEQVRAVQRAWKGLGCHLVSPFMTMSLLSLPVLPELRLTNRGLVDTRQFKFVNLISGYYIRFATINSFIYFAKYIFASSFNGLGYPGSTSEQ